MAAMTDQISNRIRICCWYSVCAIAAYKQNYEHDMNNSQMLNFDFIDLMFVRTLILRVTF
jgi:hypothetical protein